MLTKRSMRSRSCFVLSSLLVFTACDAAEKSDASKHEDRKEERKPDDTEDAKSEEAKPDELPPTFGFLPLDSGEEAGGFPDCPVDQGRLENGACASNEAFFQEQEELDAAALAAMQYAKEPKQQVEAQEKLIQHQEAQMQQAEKDLDEIIEEVKKRKKSGKGFKGKKEEFGDL